MQWRLYDNRTYYACRFGGVLRCNHPAGDMDRAGYWEEQQMTTTAHEDQFAPESTPWIEATERPVYNEREAIAAWLNKHGYREIAARIRAGEHLA